MNILPLQFKYATTIVFWLSIVTYTFFNNYKKYINNTVLFCSLVGNILATDWGNNLKNIFNIENLVHHNIPLVLSIYNFNIDEPVYLLIIYYFIYIVSLTIFKINPNKLYKKFNIISILLLIYFLFIILLKRYKNYSSK